MQPEPNEPEMPKISIIASSVRPWLWMECLDSLRKNDIKYEVRFAGNLDRYQVRPFVERYPEMEYIHTPVKPAQCYQVAFLHATYETLILYIADDAEFEPNLLDKAYEFYQSLENPKAVVSIRTNEDGRNYGTEIHTLIGWNVNTPLMAPIGLVSQRYLAQLGGFDRRFISGQWENDFCMRVYADGGTVVPFDPGPTVKIDHAIKHKGTNENNPFWTAYQHDRKVLEDTWVLGGYKPATPYVTVTLKQNGVEKVVPMFKILDNRKVLSRPQLAFEPYEDIELTKQNQGPYGIFEVIREEKIIDVQPNVGDTNGNSGDE